MAKCKDIHCIYGMMCGSISIIRYSILQRLGDGKGDYRVDNAGTIRNKCEILVFLWK